MLTETDTRAWRERGAQILPNKQSTPCTSSQTASLSWRTMKYTKKENKLIYVRPNSKKISFKCIYALGI